MPWRAGTDRRDQPTVNGCSPSPTCRACAAAVNVTCIVDESHPIETCIGDWVLIHVGFAMARIDEAEAAETLKVLTQIGEMQDEIDAMRHSAEP